MSGIVTFHAEHRPALRDGDYTVSVSQTLDPAVAPGASAAVATHKFSVAGPRYALDPQQIVRVFPPDGSLSDCSNLLPFVMLRRSTLPWERTACEAMDPAPPWLGIVTLANEPAELSNGLRNAEAEFGTISLSALKKLSSSMFVPPNVAVPAASDPPDPTIRVLALSESLAVNTLPSLGDLPFTTHCRQRDAGPLTAVVAGVRLPRAGARYSAYLVSLEGHYDAASQDPARHGLHTHPLPRRGLIVLASWRFTCADPKQDFAELARALNVGPLVAPTEGTSAPAAGHLQLGRVPVSMTRASGRQGPVWYRGPLIPAQPARPDEAIAGVRSSAELERTRMLADTGLSAAFELGRLTMLADSATAQQLLNYKRDVLRTRHEEALLAQMPSASHRTGASPAPEPAQAWADDVVRLTGLPFSYLVPEERMLPPESFRFFELDPGWIDAYLAGAWSVGYVGAQSDPPPAAWRFPRDAAGAPKRISGVLMRSAAVSGWPNLQFAGADASGAALQPLSPLTFPSRSIVLALFDGLIATVAVHLPPDHLHIGFSKTPGGGLSRPMRMRLGSNVGLPLRQPGARTGDAIKLDFSTPHTGATGAARLIDEVTRRVSFAALADAFTALLAQYEPGAHPMNAGIFALQMMEGSESVVFTIKAPEAKP